MAISKQTFIISLAALLLGAGAAYVIKPQGLPPVHGDNPKGSLPSGSPTTYKYYKVLYLKFGTGASGEPTLTIKHASFDAPNPGDESKDNVAGAINVLSGGPVQAGDPTPLGGISDGFEGFEFRSPHRVYVVVDNERVDFQEKTPLSFSHFGANVDVTAANAKVMDTNLSFYDVKVGDIKVGSGQTQRQRPLLSFKNVFRDKHGNFIPWQTTPPPPPSKKAEYSINFNLNICKIGQNPCQLGNSNHVVPMIIDPDTGNGLGAPPPY